MELVWNSMEFQRNSMEFHGIGLEFHGIGMEFHGNSMGIPWDSMGFQRNSMDFHGIGMDFHGIGMEFLGDSEKLWPLASTSGTWRLAAGLGLSSPASASPRSPRMPRESRRIGHRMHDAACVPSIRSRVDCLHGCAFGRTQGHRTDRYPRHGHDEPPWPPALRQHLRRCS